MHVVSVVITTHNSSAFVEDALRSVLMQSYEAGEILVVDDCSEDLSELQSITDCYESVELIACRSKGNANVSRNIGMSRARGTVVAFLDADDLWLPNHIENGLRVLNVGASGSFARVRVHSKSLSIDSPTFSGSDLESYLFKKDGVCISSSLILAIDAARCISFDEELEKHQDWDFVLRFARAYLLKQSKEISVTYSANVSGSMSSKVNIQASCKFASRLDQRYQYLFLRTQLRRLSSSKDINHFVSCLEYHGISKGRLLRIEIALRRADLTNLVIKSLRILRKR